MAKTPKHASSSCGTTKDFARLQDYITDLLWLYARQVQSFGCHLAVGIEVAPTKDRQYCLGMRIYPSGSTPDPIPENVRIKVGKILPKEYKGIRVNTIYCSQVSAR